MQFHTSLSGNWEVKASIFSVLVFLVSNWTVDPQGLEDSLLELSLENVSMSSLPDLPLGHLRTLRLAYNYLTSLPSDMATNMSHLRHLELAHNALQTVPPAAHALPHLRKLELRANPISTISNTSLLGAADKLDELDLAELPLNYFEVVRNTNNTIFFYNISGASCWVFVVRSTGTNAITPYASRESL